MEKQLYTCQFCQKEFEPTRRKAQKFCSATCRSKNHHHKTKIVGKSPFENLTEAIEAQKKKKMKIEEVSAAGVANAALGTLAVNTATALAKNVFVPEHKKPATKADIQELKKLINTRYFLAHNVNPDPFGRKAYFDIGTGKILYLDENSNSFHLPILHL